MEVFRERRRGRERGFRIIEKEEQGTRVKVLDHTPTTSPRAARGQHCLYDPAFVFFPTWTPQAMLGTIDPQ